MIINPDPTIHSATDNNTQVEPTAAKMATGSTIVTHFGFLTVDFLDVGR